MKVSAQHWGIGAVWLLSFQVVTVIAAQPQWEKFAKQPLSAGKKFNKFLELRWNYHMEEYPEWGTYLGKKAGNGRWTDRSAAAIERRKREVRSALAVLRGIDRKKLSASDQVNYDLYRRDLEEDVVGQKFPSEFLVVSQLDGIHQGFSQTLGKMPQKNAEDFKDILSRMRGIPRVVDENLVLLREGLKRNVTPPKVTLRDVPGQIETLLTEEEKNPLWENFQKKPADIGEEAWSAIKTEAKSILTEQIIPSLKKFHNFMTETYLPQAREAIACSALPLGQEWYAFLANHYTTTSMSPREIHELGLSEVKRIRGEMEKVIKEVKFEGTFTDFFNYLRTDKKFFYENANDLITGYRDILKRADPELPKIFGNLPRLPYGVMPVPQFMEKSQTTAYYVGGSWEAGRAGVFYANTYDLKARPKWEMEALSLHEAVPGHHLQIALAQEQQNVPEFRKHGGYTAFAEGWGLYAESLGTEMGFYQDPYSRFGLLSYEMWRSIRLVVDTGMHSLGWTREQAIDMFRQNSPKTDHDIIVEVDRYIVWPGQALAYKIGQLKISELRERTKKELGANFSIRAFHDKVLEAGALPLDVLETRLSEWIKKAKAKPSPRIPQKPSGK